MENLEASAPPLRDQVTDSLAVKVWTEVVFSLMDLLLLESPALPEGPVIDGEISSASSARIIRDGSIIYTGKIGTIFREKNQVKQVNNGQECGITVKDYMDFQKNDTIEAFSITSTERMI